MPRAGGWGGVVLGLSGGFNHTTPLLTRTHQ